MTVGSEDLAAGTRITQIVQVLEDRERESRLFNILKKAHSQQTDRVLIFALYKKEVGGNNPQIRLLF